jgi:hypothetical protein
MPITALLFPHKLNQTAQIGLLQVFGVMAIHLQPGLLGLVKTPLAVVVVVIETAIITVLQFSVESTK